MVMTLEKTVEIDADRHISLDFTAPETLPCGETQVVVLFIPGTAAAGAGKSGGEPHPKLSKGQQGSAEGSGLGMVTAERLKKLLANGSQSFSENYNAPLDLREAQLTISRNSGKSHKDMSFTKYAGCLKNSSLFKGDSYHFDSFSASTMGPP
jgi:hypothetical protein